MPPAAVVVAVAPLYRLQVRTVALSVLVPPLRKKLLTCVAGVDVERHTVADVEVGKVELPRLCQRHGRGAVPAQQQLIGGEAVAAHVEHRAAVLDVEDAGVHVQVGAQGQRAAGLHVALVVARRADAACRRGRRRGAVGEAELPTVALSVLVPPLKKKLPTLCRRR